LEIEFVQKLRNRTESKNRMPAANHSGGSGLLLDLFVTDRIEVTRDLDYFQ